MTTYFSSQKAFAHIVGEPSTEALAQINQIAYERAIARLNDEDPAREAGKQRFAEAMTAALMAALT